MSLARAAAAALAAALVAALWTGCSMLGPGPAAPASLEERRAYRAAEAALESDPAAGERQLEAFVAAWPASSLADDALMRLGERSLARGDEAAALERFYAVVTAHPNGDRSDAARVAVAQLELARDDAEAAARVMGRARLSRLAPDDQREAYRVLARVSRDEVARLRWLARLRAELSDPAELAAVDAEIDELLLGLDARELRRAARALGERPPAARVLLRAADLALDAGDVDEARSLAASAAGLEPAPAAASRLRDVRERLRLHEAGALDAADLPTFAEAERPPDTRAARGTLGVVLPLSGPFARFGEESLEGVLLAAGVFARGGAAPAVRVVIRDSAGRPDRAAEAVRELAAEGDVAAIVGPLLSGECEAAASEAERAGLPLLALTSREEIAHDRPFVFRLRTNPRDEVQILVDYAMRVVGARTFAILYPRDRYGRGLRALFWDAVEAHGGEVVGVAAYDPEAVDFGDAIRRLVGYELLTDAEKAVIREREKMLRRARRLPLEEGMALRDEALALTGPGEQPLPPIVDFDALFIPESHEKVGLIAPQLAFHEAVGMQLLGPNGWHHPELLALAEQHVEGAALTSHFFAESDLPFVQRFARGYGAVFETPPDLFAAQAYDAANLVLVQLARGRHSPESVRDGLLVTRAYPGVTGVISMGADGNAHKRPFLLGVDHGHFVELD